MSDQLSYSEIWGKVVNQLHECGFYSHSAINLWFDNVELTMLTEDRAVIVAKSTFKRDMILKNFIPSLTEFFYDVLGYGVQIDVRAAETDGTDKSLTPPPPRAYPSRTSRTQVNPYDVTPPTPHPIPFEKAFEVDSMNGSFLGEETEMDPLERERKLPPKPEDEPGYFATGDTEHQPGKNGTSDPTLWYTFDNFVVGPSNKFAYAACLAVANDPNSEYNPLFIYAPPGLGKTHLLYAIIDRIRSKRPEMNIVYVKGESFTNQMIDAIAKSRTAQFRERYRKADVLLIDDIQFIAGKEGTQEEFFHTFNALFENHKHIILTSDRPPRDIQTLEERLKSRFEWGLMADIKAPDFEHRIAILKNKAMTLGVNLPDDVLRYIAENLKHNVRQLEGAVRRIGAQSFISGEPITVDLAIGCISDLITPSEPISVTVDKIIEQVSSHYSVSIDDLKGRKRNQTIANARHVSIYMIRKLTDMSLPAIGKIFGRDHTTIMSSLDRIENETKTNPTLDIEIKELIKSIKE